MKYPERLNKLILLNSNICNLSCSYCIADGGVYTLNHDKELASIDDFKSNIDHIYSSYPDGIQYIQFFGGVYL